MKSFNAKSKNKTTSRYIPSNNTNLDGFWRKKFMQVLEVMRDQELTWGRDHWASYGINETEAKMIEKEFEKQLKWRADKVKRGAQLELESAVFDES